MLGSTPAALRIPYRGNGVALLGWNSSCSARSGGAAERWALVVGRSRPLPSQGRYMLGGHAGQGSTATQWGCRRCSDWSHHSRHASQVSAASSPTIWLFPAGDPSSQ